MTYSIIARDPGSGQMGVAVQSHYFSVGPICPWGLAGTGVVATQSLVDPSYGPLGLELMRNGKTAPDALRGLLAADEGREVRQVAMVDSTGAVAGHTGSNCIIEAGHRVGDNYCVQANMMLRNTVWDAMALAYESSSGELAWRMMAALEAAEAQGGDIRGTQSAAMLIVKGESTGKVWADRVLELRVEDHSEPLVELRRLIELRLAYDGREGATEAPTENTELRFWYAVNIAAAGKIDEAKPILDEIYAVDDNWRELLRRLPASGLFPNDAELVDKLTS